MLYVLVVELNDGLYSRVSAPHHRSVTVNTFHCLFVFLWLSGSLLKHNHMQLCVLGWLYRLMYLLLGRKNVYYSSTQQLHVGVLSPTIDDDDNKCLVDVNGRPRLIECSYAAAKRMKLHWLFTQVLGPCIIAP
ncbi:polypeptide N-acetylgalactosaminyltransferase 18 [Tachysurus ichikawai]